MSAAKKKEKIVRRAPIVLDKNTVAMLHIFEKYDSFDDVWYQDVETYIKENYEQHQKAAEELVNQLEDHWCTAFMEALIIECLKRLQTADSDFKINHLEGVLKRVNEKFPVK